jgi:hypothetical protein
MRAAWRGFMKTGGEGVKRVRQPFLAPGFYAVILSEAKDLSVE